MAYNIVTNSEVVKEIKRCKFFKTNLGLASTIDKGGNRILNEADKFSYYYNMQYKTTIYAQGNIGDMKFYTDLYIKEPIMAIYYGPNSEEFIFNVDFKIISEKGIDWFLGNMLKEVESLYEQRVKDNTEKEKEVKKEGNPDLVTFNPGAVTYSDLKSYLEKQNSERYKS